MIAFAAIEGGGLDTTVSKDEEELPFSNAFVVAELDEPAEKPRAPPAPQEGTPVDPSDEPDPDAPPTGQAGTVRDPTKTPAAPNGEQKPKSRPKPGLLSSLGPEAREGTRACALLDLERMPTDTFGRGVAQAVDASRGLRFLFAGLETNLSEKCRALTVCSPSMDPDEAWMACKGTEARIAELVQLLWADTLVTRAAGLDSVAQDFVPRNGTRVYSWPHGVRNDLVLAKGKETLLLIGPRSALTPLFEQAPGILNAQLDTHLTITQKPDQKPFFVLQLKGIHTLGSVFGQTIEIPCAYAEGRILFSVRADKMITDFTFSFPSESEALAGKACFESRLGIIDLFFGKATWSVDSGRREIVAGRASKPRADSASLVSVLRMLLRQTSPEAATRRGVSERRRRVPDSADAGTTDASAMVPTSSLVSDGGGIPDASSSPDSASSSASDASTADNPSSNPGSPAAPSASSAPASSGTAPRPESTQTPPPSAPGVVDAGSD